MIEVLEPQHDKLRELRSAPRLRLDQREVTAVIRDTGRLSAPSRFTAFVAPSREEPVVVRYRPTAEVLAERPALPLLAAMAIRWDTLVDSLLPIALGLREVMVQAPLEAGRIALAALLLHVAANLFSEVSQDMRRVDSLFRAGGSKVLQRGWLTPSQLTWTGITLAFGGLAVTGMVLVAQPSPLLATAVVLGIAVASRGSFPGAGSRRTIKSDLALLVIFGPILAVAAGAAARGHGDLESLVAGLVTAAAIGLRRHLDKMRRIPDDAALGRRTLPVALGFERSKVFAVVLAVVAVVGPSTAWVTGLAPPTVLFSLAFAPILLWVLAPALTAMIPHDPALARAGRRWHWIILVYGAVLAWGWSR